MRGAPEPLALRVVALSGRRSERASSAKLCTGPAAEMSTPSRRPMCVTEKMPQTTSPVLV